MYNLINILFMIFFDRKTRKGIKAAVLFILTLLTLHFVAACKSVEYVEVPIEKVRTDTVYNTKVQRDSIYVLDSLCIIERNDTVYCNKWKYIYKYYDHTDTLYVSHCDSIDRPVYITKYKTKTPSWAYLLLGVFVVLLGIVGVRIYVKIKNIIK